MMKTATRRATAPWRTASGCVRATKKIRDQPSCLSLMVLGKRKHSRALPPTHPHNSEKQALLADPDFETYLARVEAAWDRLVAEEDGEE
jgi:hypothetical protein